MKPVPASISNPEDFSGQSLPSVSGNGGLPESSASVTDLESALERIARLEREVVETRTAMALSSELLRNTNVEINNSLKTLERLNNELVEMDRLKTEFVANISHELRTPLNSIIGALQMMSDGLWDEEEEREAYTGNALSSAQSLLAIINDMLDVSKVNAGKLSLEVQEVPLDDLFEQLYEKLSPAAQRAGLELRFENRGGQGCTVRGDRNRIAQVFTNLIGNSIKFTPSGSVRVTSEPYPGEERTMLMSVQDTGIGIPEEFHEKVFEMFVQVDGSSRRKYEGAGLGLTICKRLVEFMGGSIWIVKNGRERGTTLSFTLPSGKAPVAVLPDATPESQSADEFLTDTF